MTVTHTSAFSLQATKLPDGFDADTLQEVWSDLADNGVATPDGDDQSELAAIVADAREHGIGLSVLVMEGNPGHDSDLRDLATAIAEDRNDTVLVLSHDWVGTFSHSYSRVRLELAEDHVRAVRPAEAVDVKTRTFVDQMRQEPMIDWADFTVVLLLGAVLAIAGLYWAKARRGEMGTSRK